MLDNVKEFARVSIFDTMNICAKDFLFFAEYLKAKAEQQRKETEQAQKKAKQNVKKYR